MTERLSHEIAALLAEDADRSDRAEWRELLRARLASSLSEGLRRDDDGAGEYDPARMAAFLDGSLPRAEWEAVAARLANDPMLRSDVASAVALLDDIEAQPDAMPEGLASRAAAVLAVGTPPGRERDGQRGAYGWWPRGPIVWSSIAAVMLLAVAIPAIVSVQDGRVTPDGATTTRNLAPPAAPAPSAIQNDRACEDAAERKAEERPSGKPASPAARPTAQPSDARRAGVRPNAQPSGEAPEDPCRPKPSDRDAGKRPPEERN